jgi:hypothetical protein
MMRQTSNIIQYFVIWLMVLLLIQDAKCLNYQSFGHDQILVWFAGTMTSRPLQSKRKKIVQKDP